MNRYGEYGDKCGSCGHLDMNNYRGYKYYCKERYTYCDPSNPKCRDYKSADEMGDRRDYYDIKKINQADCYLTTVICEILGFNDDCEILSIMRSFRNNILQKDLRYLSILIQYDVVGPSIATNLKNDENALWIAKELLKHYIRPIIKFIENKNYDAAVVVYKNMTELLIENYALVDDSYLIEDYDQSLGGHGRVHKKVNFES